MKNAQLFSCLLFTTITTHCMENTPNQLTPQKQESNNPWNAIDCIKVEQTLNADYRNYCNNRLIEYKKATFTPQDMQHIEKMAITYTGSNAQYRTLYNVRDEEDNYFPHIAIHKFDLPVLTWLVTQKLIHYPKNKQGNGFMEACVDHLSPYNTIDAEKKQIVYDMLNVIITNYGNQLAKSLRQPIVEKLIRLQIEHRKQFNNDILAHITFTPLLAQGKDNNIAIIDLSKLYQQVTDTNGDTFSHVIVKTNDINELYHLIQSNRVSPASNKAGKTVVDLALANFQSYINCPPLLPNEATETDELLDSLGLNTSKNSRCCLFILLNYVKAQQTGNALSSFSPCCDKHVIK